MDEIQGRRQTPELTRIHSGIQRDVQYEIPITAFDEARPYLSRMIYSAYEGAMSAN
jgi:hypothetical protein